jgi:hypothetical protein
VSFLNIPRNFRAAETSISRRLRKRRETSFEGKNEVAKQRFFQGRLFEVSKVEK